MMSPTATGHAAMPRRTLLMSLAAAATIQAPPPDTPRQDVEIVIGLDGSGTPTRPWLNVLRHRVDARTLTTIARTAKPLSREEGEWVDLVRQSIGGWLDRLEHLNAPFRSVPLPARMVVLLGNQGGNDAFGIGPNVLAFDLSELLATYGAAGLEKNRALMPRLLAHEYTHLLVNRRLESAGWSVEWAARAPLLRAVRVLYNEGLGNLRSIEGDERWLSPGGDLSARAQQTLSDLQPVLLERLEGLRANPSAEVVENLMRNISQGPFAGKWGALPIALWLASDSRFDPDRLAGWVEAGPDNILDLAARHASPSLQPSFRTLSLAVRDLVARHRQDCWRLPGARGIHASAPTCASIQTGPAV